MWRLLSVSPRRPLMSEEPGRSTGDQIVPRRAGQCRAWIKARAVASSIVSSLGPLSSSRRPSHARWPVAPGSQRVTLVALELVLMEKTKFERPTADEVLELDAEAVDSLHSDH